MQNGIDWFGYVAFNGLSKSSGNIEISPPMLVVLEMLSSSLVGVAELQMLRKKGKKRKGAEILISSLCSAKLKNNREVCINPETKWLQQYLKNAINK